MCQREAHKSNGSQHSSSSSVEKRKQPCEEQQWKKPWELQFKEMSFHFKWLVAQPDPSRYSLDFISLRSEDVSTLNPMIIVAAFCVGHCVVQSYCPYQIKTFYHELVKTKTEKNQKWTQHFQYIP